jgi:hypothetical protein
LIWQQYGDLDVWSYTPTTTYDAGGGPGLSDTGGGSSFRGIHRRLYGVFPGTDAHKTDQARVYISTSLPATIEKILEKKTYLAAGDLVNILPLENKHEELDKVKAQEPGVLIKVATYDRPLTDREVSFISKSSCAILGINGQCYIRVLPEAVGHSVSVQGSWMFRIYRERLPEIGEEPEDRDVDDLGQLMFKIPVIFTGFDNLHTFEFPMERGYLYRVTRGEVDDTCLVDPTIISAQIYGPLRDETMGEGE